MQIASKTNESEIWIRSLRKRTAKQNSLWQKLWYYQTHKHVRLQVIYNVVTTTSKHMSIRYGTTWNNVKTKHKSHHRLCSLRLFPKLPPDNALKWNAPRQSQDFYIVKVNLFFKSSQIWICQSARPRSWETWQVRRMDGWSVKIQHPSHANL